MPAGAGASQGADMAVASTKWQPGLMVKTSAAKCDGEATSILVSSAKGKVAVHTAGALSVREGPPALHMKQELRAQAPITAAAFSQKGTELVTGGADGFLKWWQVESGDEMCSTQFPLDEASKGDAIIPHVACCRVGFVAAACGRLLCIFGPGGEHMHTISGLAHQVQQVLWLGDATLAAASGTQISTWSVTTETCEEVGAFTANPPGVVLRVAASPNARYLAAAVENGTVQVWDTKHAGSTDPVLVLGEGVDGPVVALSWDAGSKLLAGACGCEALVWDVVSAREGRVDRYVGVGADTDATITTLAFQSNGQLLAAGTSSGQCLVYDSAGFTPGGATEGFAQHVSAGKLGGEGAPEAITALAWHNSGYILVGTDAGNVAALQPVRIPRPSADNGNDSQRLRQEQNGGAKRGKGSTFAAPAVAAGAAAAATAAVAGGLEPRLPPPVDTQRSPAGWGGKPLVTNGMAVPDPDMGGGMRGRGARGRNSNKASPPLVQPYPGAYRHEGVAPGTPVGGAAHGAGAPPGAMAGPGIREGGPPGGGVPQGWAVNMNMVPVAPPHMWRPHMMPPMQPMPYLPYHPQMVPVGAMPGAPPMQHYVPVPMGAPTGARGAYATGPRPAGGQLSRQGSGASRSLPSPAGGPPGRRSSSAGAERAAPAPTGGREPPVQRGPGSGGDRGGGDDRGGGGDDGHGGGVAYASMPNGQHPPPVSVVPPPDSVVVRAGGASDGGAGGRHGSGAGSSTPTAAGGLMSPGAMGGRIAVPGGGAMAAPGMVPVYMYPQPGPGQWGMPYPQPWTMPYGYAPFGQYYPAQQQHQQHQHQQQQHQQQQQQQQQQQAHHNSVPQHAQQQQHQQPMQHHAPMHAVQQVQQQHYMHSQHPMHGGGRVPLQSDMGGEIGGRGDAHGGEYAGEGGSGGGEGYDDRGGAHAAPNHAAPPRAGGSGRTPAGGSGGGGYDARGSASGYAAAGQGSDGGGAAAEDPARPMLALYVGNLAPTVDENVLYAQFQQFGPLASAQVIRDRETNHPRGFGFVTFQQSVHAHTAMQHMNGMQLGGAFDNRPLRVSRSNRR